MSTIKRTHRKSCNYDLASYGIWYTKDSFASKYATEGHLPVMEPILLPSRDAKNQYPDGIIQPLDSYASMKPTALIRNEQVLSNNATAEP